MQTSKYELGDKVVFAGIKGTIINTGVLGSKLSPNRTFVYDINLENGKRATCVAEWALSKCVQ